MTDVVTALKAASKELGAVAARQVVFFAIIGLMFLTAAGFGLAAGWTVLAAQLNAVDASLIIAGALGGAALIALLADRLMRRRRKAKRTHRASAQQPPLAPLLVQTFVASLHAGRSLNAQRR